MAFVNVGEVNIIHIILSTASLQTYILHDEHKEHLLQMKHLQILHYRYSPVLKLRAVYRTIAIQPYYRVHCDSGMVFLLHSTVARWSVLYMKIRELCYVCKFDFRRSFCKEIKGN